MDTDDHELILRLQPQTPPFHIVACHISEHISRLTHAEIELSLSEDLDVEALLESEAQLILRTASGASRSWTLHVGHGGYAGAVRDELRYTLHLYPKLWLLRHTLDTRKFRKLSAREIVTQVLGEGAIDHSWTTTQDFATRKYCLQYGESHFDFISRLLEFEGVYYAFRDDGVMVLADASQTSPEATLDGSWTYDVMPDAGALQTKQARIFELKTARRMVSGKATVNDFNWKTPAVKLIESAGAEENADLEVYDYPTGYRRPDQGKRLSKLRLEAMRVPARTIRGGSTIPVFAPAHLMAIDGQMHARFTGEYLLVGVEHAFFNADFAELAMSRQGAGYGNTFEAIPRDVPYRPPLLTARPEIAGCHTAMVRGPIGEEIHTDAYGRCRVQFHWDRHATGTDEDSRWIRVLQESASGSVLARVGWEMSVAYIDGDPDRPIGLARQINGAMTPEYGQPANKTRMTIKTPSYPNNGGFNELRLEDAADAQHFDWHAQRDLTQRVMHDRTEHIGANETRSVGIDMSHTVGRDQSLSVGADMTRKVAQNMTLLVSGSRTKTVGGDELVEVGGQSSIVVSGDDTEMVGGARKTTVGEAGLGTISRQVGLLFNRVVSGSNIATGGGIKTAGGKMVTHSIGGSQIVQAGSGRRSDVSGSLTVTLGGSKVVISGKDVGYQATESTVSVAGAAAWTSAQQINIWGKTIELSGDSAVDLANAGLKLALSPGAASVAGKLKIECGGNLEVFGSVVNLNS